MLNQDEKESVILFIKIVALYAVTMGVVLLVVD